MCMQPWFNGLYVCDIVRRLRIMYVSKRGRGPPLSDWKGRCRPPQRTLP